MLALLRDPRIMNFVIMALYSFNILRWLVARRPWDALYWFAAFLITFTVTFGYKH